MVSEFCPGTFKNWSNEEALSDISVLRHVSFLFSFSANQSFKSSHCQCFMRRTLSLYWVERTDFLLFLCLICPFFEHFHSDCFLPGSIRPPSIRRLLQLLCQSSKRFEPNLENWFSSLWFQSIRNSFISFPTACQGFPKFYSSLQYIGGLILPSHMCFFKSQIIIFTATNVRLQQTAK